MSYSELLFFLFFSLILISGFLVVLSKNPVHSVLFLILTFTLSACVLLLLGVEFLGIIYIVVYVGAIAVLFLFVVMMLNIKLTELGSNLRFLPLSGLVVLLLFLELFYIIQGEVGLGYTLTYDSWVSYLDGVSNLEVLGSVLFTYGVYYFLLSGIILFVSMVGTIVLTLSHELNVRRQEVYVQVGRDYRTAVQKMKICPEVESNH